MTPNPSVLVVDDEASIREILRRFLERAGCSVKEAPSAMEALESMISDPAAIIFADIGMPGHDGFWLLDRVHERWPETTFVMASGADVCETLEAARRPGVVDCLSKPFGREPVLEALARARAVPPAQL